MVLWTHENACKICKQYINYLVMLFFYAKHLIEYAVWYNVYLWIKDSWHSLFQGSLQHGFFTFIFIYFLHMAAYSWRLLFEICSFQKFNFKLLCFKSTPFQNFLWLAHCVWRKNGWGGLNIWFVFLHSKVTSTPLWFKAKWNNYFSCITS